MSRDPPASARVRATRELPKLSRHPLPACVTTGHRVRQGRADREVLGADTYSPSARYSVVSRLIPRSSATRISGDSLTAWGCVGYKFGGRLIRFSTSQHSATLGGDVTPWLSAHHRLSWYAVLLAHRVTFVRSLWFSSCRVSSSAYTAQPRRLFRPLGCSRAADVRTCCVRGRPPI